MLPTIFEQQTSMTKTVFILTIILSLCKLASGQVFPDSLKGTWISKLKNKESITIYTCWETCFTAGYEKFQLTKKGEQYVLTAFIPISAYDLKLKRRQLDSIQAETLNFKKLNSYVLTDTNIIALSLIEFHGTKCGVQSRKAGQAIKKYKFLLNNDKKSFTNNCYITTDKNEIILFDERISDIGDIEELAYPEKYYDDCDAQDK